MYTIKQNYHTRSKRIETGSAHAPPARRRSAVAVLMLVFILASALSLPASAANTAVTARVRLNGRAVLSGKARIMDSTTYVPFRAFVGEMDNSTVVSWNASSRTATAVSDGSTVKATVGKQYIVKNGASIYSSAKNRLIVGTLYVPIRPMATAYGYTVSWDGSTRTASLMRSGGFGSGNTGGSNGTDAYSSADLYWMSRIIEAEAGGESYTGKLAVGTVVMNRVASKDFPNTVYGVIFDRKYGVQFTPTANGRIYCTPSTDSVRAAKEVLSGYRVNRTMQYFVNPALASDRWFRQNLTYVTTIGCHAFYAPK